MSKMLLQEIPKRLEPVILHISYFPLSARERHILLLAKNLQFFEIKSCEIIFAIDLKDSVLKELDLNSLSSYANSDEKSEQMTSSVEESSEEQNSKESIKFDRFVLLEGTNKRLFILINIYDKLIVLERCWNGLKLIEQYENVSDYEICDPEKTFRPKVVIQFNNEKIIETRFVNEISSVFDKNTAHSSKNSGNEVFETLFEKVKELKTELSFHKALTKKGFISYKNTLMFGSNYVRSTEKEEKQPLRKYGDVWMRFFRDYLIIGVPVINYCSQSPKTLQNIRVALLSSDTEKELTKFEYNLYQLNNDSYTYENFDKLLESEIESKEFEFEKEWLPVKTQSLLPECSGVILLRMKWDVDATSKPHNYVCFILYDIIKGGKTFTQQLCIEDIIIESDIFFKEQYQVQFALKTLYQDLLSITCTSFYKSFQIQFESEEDFFSEFCNFLKEKLKFICIQREEDNIELMDVDDLLYRNHSTLFQKVNSINVIYLHKEDTSSYWYGTLLRLHTSSQNSFSMKIYTKSEDRILSLIQFLYKEFSKECKILPTSCTSEQNRVKLHHLEDRLRKELQFKIQFCQENVENNDLKRTEIYKFQQELLAHELETDLSALDIM